VDQARRLTNFSTGRLGGELANALASAGHEVLLFLSETAPWRLPLAAVTVRPFSTTESLLNALETEASGAPMAVFQVAAVSDFAVGTRARRTGPDVWVPETAGKPSTAGGSLWLELVPTPKILPRLRDWFPRAHLVGWKYEVDGDPETAVQRGWEQIRSARTDACVVNGPAWGRGFCRLRRDGGRVQVGSSTGLIQTLLADLPRSTPSQ
jgi:phosphopantothenoylcysteine decarboxylase/phosphopantothenate--cysteine ligase